MKLSLEIGRDEFEEAGKTLALLRAHPYDGYMSVRREAILYARRNGDLETAEAILTSGINESFHEAGKINADLHSSRCIIRAKRGDVQGAKADLGVVRQKHLNAEQIERRLEVYILSAEGRHDEAIKAIDSIPKRTKLDDIPLRDVLQQLIADPSVAGYKRGEAGFRLRDLIPLLEKITEYDIV